MLKKKYAVAALMVVLLTQTASPMYTGATRIPRVDVNVNLVSAQPSNLNSTLIVTTAEALKATLADENVKYIILGCDIEVMGELNIERPVHIDLNGHAIKFLTHNSLKIGKVYYKSEKVTKYEPGHWENDEPEEEVIEAHYENRFIPGHYEGYLWVADHVEQVFVPREVRPLPAKRRWVPGHWYDTTEQRLHREDISVVIENGLVFGKDGNKGKYELWNKGGENGSDAIKMISGRLTLKNLRVYGGNGGNGLDGDGVIGRGGGDGGNGGNAVYIEDGKEFIANGCKFVEGEGGKGGKKDYSGWTSFFCFEGCNGKKGSKVARGVLSSVKVHL